MAGIGFELKKLFAKRGIFASFRAIGYSTAVVVGPMLLGILLLLGIMGECNFFDRNTHERELLVCMTTYSLLGSLIITSFFSMIVTRFLSDMLFSEHTETVLPSFFGINAVTLTIGGLISFLFLLYSGTSFHISFFVWCFFEELVVTWNAQYYLTAIKEYRSILLSYLLAIAGSLLLLCILFLKGAETVQGALIALCFGYGLMLILHFRMLLRHFPDSSISPFIFLRWADKFFILGAVGFLTTVGMFSHLIIIWFSPLQIVVEWPWIGAPYHDVPALIAFLSTIVTSVSFVVSVEVNFYPKYREYYALFNDKGTIRDIQRVENEMLETLQRELRFTAIKQLFVTAVCISAGELLLTHLPLGFNDLMFGYFRTLSVAYGIYAVANMFGLILLYFTDYTGAFRAALLFAVSASGFTLLFNCFDTAFYGFGFLIGSALYFLYSLLRLNKYTQKLPYYVLAAQPMFSETKAGFFTHLGKSIEEIMEGLDHHEK